MLSSATLAITEKNLFNQPESREGFYAAGETVAGVHGAFYCGGNACGFAHTSGYMAGKYVTGYKEA